MHQEIQMWLTNGLKNVGNKVVLQILVTSSMSLQMQDLYMQKSIQIQNKKTNFKVTYEKNTINYRNIHEPDYICKFFFFQYERKTKTSKL